MADVLTRFLTYVQHTTTSNEEAQTTPSTNEQLLFAAFLAEECRSIGLCEVTVSEYGYVMATLPANTEADLPVIGFIAHMDTSPDAPGASVSPQLHEKYDGSSIPLKGITLSPEEFPELLHYRGDTLVTSDGTTLLGADDKAGIAEILTAMEYLLLHTEILHGTIRIAFTPDEEIGRGADRFDVEAFGAKFAYTIDGGRLGELEYENFNAARAVIHIEGRSVHPGTAKGKMINAVLMAAELAEMLPKEETPQNTEGYAGFFHLHAIEGTVSHARMTYLIRDFDENSFAERKNRLQKAVLEINRSYGEVATLTLRDEYCNMITQIQDRMEIIDLAKQAMADAGVTPVIQPIRGGTDGARLSFMGLPCPNLFAGGHNFHGPYEFIPVSSMEKAVEVIVNIASLVENTFFKTK